MGPIAIISIHSRLTIYHPYCNIYSNGVPTLVETHGNYLWDFLYNVRDWYDYSIVSMNTKWSVYSITENENMYVYNLFLHTTNWWTYGNYRKNNKKACISGNDDGKSILFTFSLESSKIIWRIRIAIVSLLYSVFVL